MMKRLSNFAFNVNLRRYSKPGERVTVFVQTEESPELAIGSLTMVWPSGRVTLTGSSSK